jgi:hypothetical protein
MAAARQGLPVRGIEHRSGEQAVARAFLEISDYLGEDDGTGRIVIRHKINQSDLAAMAGVAREYYSQAGGPSPRFISLQSPGNPTCENWQITLD